MARYQLWDIPSATMLDETDDVFSIATTVQALIDDEGVEYLDDLSLSEQQGETGRFESYAGSDVMLVLQEQLANAQAH